MTEHIEEHCGTANCPRCVAVWAMLERFKFSPEFTRGTKVFQLAEHAVNLEEASIEYRMGRVPDTLLVSNADEIIAEQQNNGGQFLLDKMAESAKVRKFNMDVLTGTSDRHAYLIDDVQLETGVCGGGIEVWLDNFVCRKREQRTVVKEIGRSFKDWGRCVAHHVVCGATTWPARAAGVALKVHPKDVEEYIETTFNGSLHLVYVVNGCVVWACKNLALIDYKVLQTPKTVYLQNPTFLCAGVVDKRTDKLGDEDALYLTLEMGEEKE